MRYVSTRGRSPEIDFSDALLAGLASDGGLYMPVSWPRFDEATIAGFAGMPFHEVAYQVLKPFVGASIPDQVLRDTTRDSYACFRQ